MNSQKELKTPKTNPLSEEGTADKGRGERMRMGRQGGSEAGISVSGRREDQKVFLLVMRCSFSRTGNSKRATEGEMCAAFQGGNLVFCIESPHPLNINSTSRINI